MSAHEPDPSLPYASASSDPQSVVVVRSEERLRPDVERFATEHVRVVKRIVTESRTVEVQVRREELLVEHTPARPGATPGSGTGWADGGSVLEVVLHEEVVDIVTRVVPVERVRVRIDGIVEETTVSADLRRERIDVQDDSQTRA